MKKYNRGSIPPEAIIPLGILAVIIFGIASLWLVIFAGTPVGAGGNVGKVMLVIRANIGFWIVLCGGIGFGFYRKLTNPEEFTWAELPIQLAATTLSVVLLFFLFFSTSAKLSDTEILNGYVTGAEYYEAWTERVETKECKGYDDKGRCKGYRTKISYVHHPPEWGQLTTVGDISIDGGLYQKFVRYFGNEKKENIYRPNQSSFGDGDKFYVTFDSSRHEIIPASRQNWYVNYLRASDSIEKKQGGVQIYKDLLRPYPTVYYGNYGEIELDRVVEAGVNLPVNWKNDVDKTLDKALTSLGRQKQVNILVYAVNTADQGFVHALEESWVKGKKNDVIVILGVSEFPKVSFAYVMAWTKIEEFRLNLRNRILGIGDISDGKAFANIVIEEISKPPVEGGFERRPMADLEYLIADIRLPWWCQLIIVLVGGGISWIVSVLMIDNQTKNYTNTKFRYS